MTITTAVLPQVITESAAERKNAKADLRAEIRAALSQLPIAVVGQPAASLVISGGRRPLFERAIAELNRELPEGFAVAEVEIPTDHADSNFAAIKDDLEITAEDFAATIEGYVAEKRVASAGDVKGIVHALRADFDDLNLRAEEGLTPENLFAAFTEANRARLNVRLFRVESVKARKAARKAAKAAPAAAVGTPAS